jgi:hypothetical protein
MMHQVSAYRGGNNPKFRFHESASNCNWTCMWRRKQPVVTDRARSRFHTMLGFCNGRRATDRSSTAVHGPTVPRTVRIGIASPPLQIFICSGPLGLISMANEPRPPLC